MAAQTSKSGRNQANLTRAQLRRVWDAISTNDWLSLPNSAVLAVRNYRQNELICLCPNPEHTDTSPSFHIYPKQYHGYCFGCGYRPTDPIELIANMAHMSYGEALTYASNAYPGAAVLKQGATATYIQQQLITQYAKRLFMHVCHEQLVLASHAYREHIHHKLATPAHESKDQLSAEAFERLIEDDYAGESEGGINSLLDSNVIPITGAPESQRGLGDYDYAFKTVEWLVVDRGIPLERLPDLPIGIVPPSARVPKLAHSFPKHAKDVRAGRVEYDVIVLIQELQRFLSLDCNKGTLMHSAGSVIFPLCTDEHHIACFRVRQPNAPGEAKRIGLFQDGFDTNSGFFGLNFAPYIQHHKSTHGITPKSYTVVEGEFDALQPMVRVLETGKVVQPVISAGGNSAITIMDEVVETNDIKLLRLMGDAPTKGSKNTSANVITQWIQSLSKCSISVFSGEAWESLNPAEDLDHAYTRTKLPIKIIEDVIYNPANYIAAWKWLYLQSLPYLDQFSEDDAYTLNLEAKNLGQTLKNLEDIDAFCQAITQKFPTIKAAPLKRNIIATGDDETSFIYRIASAIAEHYNIIGINTNPTGYKELRLFHKEKCRFASIRLDSEQSVVQELALMAGTLPNFITEYIGSPEFLLAQDGPAAKKGAAVLQYQDRKIRYYVKEAVLSLSEGAYDVEHLKSIRAGYHYHGDKEYIVHATSVFTLHRDITGTLKALSEDHTARIDNFLVDIYGGDKALREPWYTPQPEDVRPSFILDAQQYDMRQTFMDLCNYFNTGFTFEQQKLTCQLLATLILAFPIMSCFDRQVVVHFTGDSGSGKTTLMSVFSPVDKATSKLSLQLLFASHYSSNITASAFPRMASASALLYCIDELEFDSNTKKRNSEGVLEALRGITTGGGSKTISNMNGMGTHTFSYNVPVIFGSITGTERPQDLNRLLFVHMKKREAHTDPNSAIYERFSPEKINALRKAVNFGMLQHIPKIRAFYEELRGQYKNINDQLPYPVEFRFMSAFFPLFAVMKALDLDYINFFRAYVTQNEVSIKRNTSISESETYISRILHSNVIKLSNYKETNKLYSLANILVNRSHRYELNDAGVGVYFDEPSHLMLFNLEPVISTILQSHIRNSTGITALGLRNILERHKAALPPQQIAQTGILRKAATHMGAGLRLSDIVVFDCKYWLNEHTDSSQELCCTDYQYQEENADDRSKDVDPEW